MIHPKAVREINDSPVDNRAKLSRILELIAKIGPLGLREPHVKSLGNKFVEIRLSGRHGISRVIYIVLTDRKVALLHAFIKKTPKTPTAALECALRRLKDMKND